MVLHRPATPGWWGAAADWLRLLLGALGWAGASGAWRGSPVPL